MHTAKRTLVYTTCLLMLVSFPHALEDFHYGDLMRVGINMPFGITILILMYALQLAGMVSVLGGSRRGALLLAATGAIWCIGAVLLHGHDAIFAGPDYRHGFISKLLELLIIALGATAAGVGISVAWQSRAKP